MRSVGSAVVVVRARSGPAHVTVQVALVDFGSPHAGEPMTTGFSPAPRAHHDVAHVVPSSAPAEGHGSNQRLTLRSHAKRGVSKGGHEHVVRRPSFETAASRPPQDEVLSFGRSFTRRSGPAAASRWRSIAHDPRRARTGLAGLWLVGRKQKGRRGKRQSRLFLIKFLLNLQLHPCMARRSARMAAGSACKPGRAGATSTFGDSSHSPASATQPSGWRIRRSPDPVLPGRRGRSRARPRRSRSPSARRSYWFEGRGS